MPKYITFSAALQRVSSSSKRSSVLLPFMDSPFSKKVSPSVSTMSHFSSACEEAKPLTGGGNGLDGVFHASGVYISDHRQIVCGCHRQGLLLEYFFPPASTGHMG